jgi:hypothetical protein
MQLHEVVPWGRSLDEYRRLFALSETDLQTRLLGCGDGPASFNAELAALGKTQRLVSVDPLYAFSGPEIASRVEQTYETIVSHVKRNHDRYVWTYFKDSDALGAAPAQGDEDLLRRLRSRSRRRTLFGCRFA